MLRFCTTQYLKYYCLGCLVLCLLLSTGCGGGTTLQFTTPSHLTLRAGQLYTFSVTHAGTSSASAITWSVANNATSSQPSGSINSDGVYTAPAQLSAPITVTVTAQLLGNQSVQAASTVQVLPAMPSPSVASPAIIPITGSTIQISGANLLPQTQAFVNGSPANLQYKTPSQAFVAVYPSPGAGEASVAFKNPWDTSTSPAISIPVESAPGADPAEQVTGQPLPPSSQGYILGCTNPNAGTPTNDWGTGTDPVYVSPTSLTLGNPTYTSNTIFWTSDETVPGQSVLITGAFTASPKTVRLAFIPPASSDWQALVQASNIVVPVRQQSSSAIYFTVPGTMPAGIYGFEIDDPTAPPVLGLANSPSIDWAIGGPNTVSQSMALQHRIYDCGVEAGGVLHIFGKNYLPTDQVSLIDSNGVATPLEVTEQEASTISVAIPPTLQPGQYTVLLGEGSAPATSTQVPISVYPAFTSQVTEVDCGGLTGDDHTDNSPALQACLDSHAPAAGSSGLAYIKIPAGSFDLNEPIYVRSHEVLVGTRDTASQLICQPSGAPPSFWLELPQFSGVVNLSISGPADPYIIRTASDNGNPASSGHIFLLGDRIEATKDLTGGGEQAVFLTGPDIQIYNSQFINNSFLGLVLSYGDGAIISGNEFIINNGWMLIGDSQNVEFAHNTVHTIGGSGTPVPSSGLSVSRANNQYGASALSQNIYVGHNQFEDLGASNQQILLNDGNGGSYYGPIESVTDTSVVLADPPAWNWMGTSNPRASMISVVSGTGVGEYSLIADYSGRTIKLLWPWKVLPDHTSIVAITQYDRNMTWVHNTFSNTLGVSILLSDAVGSVVEDNLLTNSGSGILISAFGEYGGPAGYAPVIDTDVLRNTIQPGQGTLIQPSVDTNVAGIGILDMPGVLLSGLLVRGNQVTAENTIYITNGWNQLSGALVEGNHANLFLAPYGPLQGISILNNTSGQ